MNLAQYQYSVAGFRALEVYPFSKMAKRYFHAYRENTPDQIYRILVYPHNHVKVQPLINTLKSLKTITHPSLGKILHLYEETILTKIGQKGEEETVIAVVFEDNLQSSFICLYDFIVQMGTLSESLVRDIAYNLVELVDFMDLKGFSHCFNSNDVLFEKATGRIRIDNYGDGRHFVLKEDLASDVWELGSLLFTLLKGNPPYSKKTASDPHYSCLQKGQFQKFWGIIPEKPVKNPTESAIKFINFCFEKQTKISDLKQNPFLLDYQPISEYDRALLITNIIAAKQSKKNEKNAQQRERKQKMMQAARQRTCLLTKRGSHNVQIEAFLDNLVIEQQKIRSIDKKQLSEDQSQKLKIQIAHLLTLLSLNENKGVRISEIKDHKDTITFRIKTEVGEAVSIDSQVEIVLQKFNNELMFKCHKIEGTFFQGLWVNNYIKELCAEI